MGKVKDDSNYVNKHTRIHHMEKLQARNLLGSALQMGHIIRPDHCTKCLVKCTPDCHHEDYRRPLDPVWLCSKCHVKRHKELKTNPLPAKVLNFNETLEDIDYRLRNRLPLDKNQVIINLIEALKYAFKTNECFDGDLLEIINKPKTEIIYDIKRRFHKKPKV